MMKYFAFVASLLAITADSHQLLRQNSSTNKQEGHRNLVDNYSFDYLWTTLGNEMMLQCKTFSYGGLRTASCADDDTHYMVLIESEGVVESMTVNVYETATTIYFDGLGGSPVSCSQKGRGDCRVCSEEDGHFGIMTAGECWKVF